MFGLFAKAAKKSRPIRRRTTSRFCIESLETRQLMARDVLETLETSPAAIAPIETPSDEAAIAPKDAADKPATVAKVSSSKKAPAAKVDLDATIVAGLVVPTQYNKLLNLLHFYGGEKVTVPTKLKNFGPDTAEGKVTLSVYLSTTNTVDKNAVKLGQKLVNIRLANNQTESILMNVTIPRSLKVGTKYFLVSKITTPIKQSTINDVRGTDRQFEFVGTPAADSPFFKADAQGNLPYYDVIYDTLNGKLMYDAPYQLNTPEIMIAEHEDSSTAAYMNPKMEPALATGINLIRMTPTVKAAVLRAVRDYHKKMFNQNLSSDDDVVIDWLVQQAVNGGAGPVISQAQATYLFNVDYKERGKRAEALLGKSAWSQINPPARIAVMDMIYDIDTIDKKVVASLKAKDYVRAGFDLLSTGSAGRDFKRVRAEYQNLVYSNRTALGSIVKT